VRKLWKATGEADPLSGRGTIDYLQAILKGTSHQLKNNMVFYRQFVFWLCQLATLLTFTRGQDAKPSSYRFLAGALCSLSLSIQHLVLLGHDVSAKILVRSLCEYADVLALLITRPELTTEFELEEFTKANQFWHRFLKSEKARRALFNSIDSKSERSEWYVEWSNWRKQEDTILSISAHPTFVAAAMSLIPVHTRGSKRPHLPAYLGCVSDASIRTMVYTMYSLLPVVASAAFPFGGTQFKPLISFDQSVDLHRQIEAGRQVLIGILAFLSSEGRESPHFQPADPYWPTPNGS
jgi:hypothetical protein